MSESEDHTAGGSHGPDYDVEVDADELLADLAEMSAQYARDYVEHHGWWRDSPVYDPFTEAKYWAQEDLGGRGAIENAILTLQPDGSSHLAGKFLNADGTVDVRGFMSWVSDRGDYAHEDSHGPYTETRHADERESAYAAITSLLRDEYGVGWPRIDDLGGVVEEDLP